MQSVAMRMKRTIIGLVFAVIAAGVWLAVRPNGDTVLRPPENPASTPTSPKDAGSKAGDAASPSREGKNKPSVSVEDLESVRRLIGESTDPQRTKALLDQLSEKLKGVPSEKAAEIIREVLSNRLDAATKLPFAIGTSGNLDTAPTFRVWLLDQLGRLNPEAAADYGRQILTTPESADEWALALRNFARVRTTPADSTFLKTKARELLREPRWQKEQSAGWLEAFDVVVHTRATELAPELSKLLIRTEDAARPSAHAAYLTLDRLVLAEPATMLETLAAAPDLMKGREQTRANYFARADVRDAKQRAIVERYMLDAARPAQELETFAGLYPSANMMVSKNLLTPTVTFSRDDLLARDREALRVVDEWAGDPRFERLKPQIQKIRDRLAVFVKQSEK